MNTREGKQNNIKGNGTKHKRLLNIENKLVVVRWEGGRRIGKIDEDVYIYNGVYMAIKKNEILPFATTWMELEGIMLSEISQRKTNII